MAITLPRQTEKKNDFLVGESLLKRPPEGSVKKKELHSTESKSFDLNWPPIIKVYNKGGKYIYFFLSY